MVGHDDFFNKLIGETYSLVERETEPAPAEKLADYFEKKYTESHSSLSLFGAVDFNESLNVFRVRYKNNWLDFPANWSIFAKLSHSIQLKMNVKIIINHDHHDRLCQILGIPLEQAMVISYFNGVVTFAASSRSIQQQAA
jgi:hypothetical protein